MRILVLSSSTGGGHDMRARSIVSWAAKLSTEEQPIEVMRYQALERSSGLYRFGVNLYNWIQKYSPRLHHLYFNFLEVFQVSMDERWLLGKRRFEEMLKIAKPDVIVSVHAHTNHAFREAAKRILPTVSFVVYCGEMFGGYGFSRHWVDSGADAFVGATAEICEAAVALEMPAALTMHGGFLLDPRFYKEDTDANNDLKKDLGLKEDRFTLMLSTGANGAQNHIDFLKALDRAGLKLQVIALCGRSEEARKRVASFESQNGDILVSALGYREDMLELMSCSDVMVARPGTGTTSEAIMAGCPILFNTLGGIMPQEWITIKYLQHQGLELNRIKRADDLAAGVRELMTDQARLHEMSKKMRDLRPDRHPKEIFQYLSEISLKTSALS